MTSSWVTNRHGWVLWMDGARAACSTMPRSTCGSIVASRVVVPTMPGPEPVDGSGPGRRWSVLLEEAIPGDEGDPLPHPAEADGLAGGGERQQHKNDGVDDVVVHERVVLGRQDGGPHHDQQCSACDGRDAHRDPER